MLDRSRPLIVQPDLFFISTDRLSIVGNRIDREGAHLGALGEGGCEGAPDLVVDALVIPTAQGDQTFVLRGADHPYRVLVETMNEGTVTLSADGTILYCNPRFAEIVSIPAEQLTGWSIRPLVLPADLSRFDAMLAQGLMGPERGEICLQAGEQTQIPVFLSLSPLDLDEVPRICLVVTDLTKQKHQERIIASQQLSGAILDQSAEAIFVCDQEGRVIRMSKRAYKLCGPNPLMQYFDKLCSLQPSHAHDASSSFSVQAALRGEVFQGLVVTLNRTSASPLYFVLNANPLNPQGIEIRGCVISLADITERKRVEEEREELLKRLEVERGLLEKSQADLHEKVETLEKFHDVVVGRELKMIELEKHMRALQNELAEHKAVGRTDR